MICCHGSHRTIALLEWASLTTLDWTIIAERCMAVDRTKVLESHYLWCLREGRDVSWYKPQAPSSEPQASSRKPQATSSKRQAASRLTNNLNYEIK